MGATANEVYMVELVNAERAALGIAPLAINDELGLAADRHADWMLATDTFSHTGVNGSTPGDRARDAGYAFNGAWSWGENVAWASLRGAPGITDEVELNHEGLMNSPGHRANILNEGFREIGLGVRQGEFDGWDAAMIAQVFARSGTDRFVTGVAIEDGDDDGAYDVGEGRGGIVVAAKLNGQVVASDVTGDAGDYALGLANGTYTVTFDGANATTVTVDGANVKLDHLVGDAPADPVADPVADEPPTVPTIVGSDAADRLFGTALDEKISGRAGDDRLVGQEGDDEIYGGDGNDSLWGGEGADLLDGGEGTDAARYDLGGAVRADLAWAESNTGEAAGDTYVGIENLVGSGSNDALLGDRGDNVFWGGNGADWLLGRDGDDTLIGGNGNDVLVGGAGADMLVGGAGRDTVIITQASTLDMLFGDRSTGEAAGDRHSSIERALGSAGNDKMLGTNGAETLEGRGGRDTLVGRGGDDVVQGGEGNDSLYGGNGRDWLGGQDGDDLLIGGAGLDQLIGGAGSDVFRIHQASHSARGAGDLIRDFERGADKLHLGFIDADASAAGNQALDFVNAFTGAGGEVIAIAGSVRADMDGDGQADMVVRFANGLLVDETDLIL